MYQKAHGETGVVCVPAENHVYAPHFVRPPGFRHPLPSGRQGMTSLVLRFASP